LEETLSAPYLQGTGAGPWRAFDKTTNKKTGITNDTRNIEAHNNLQPYLVVVPMMKL
jgi:hypothetical protein